MFQQERVEKSKAMEDESKKAKLRALRILTKMDKTEADLKASLERAGFSESAVKDALDYVKSFGYIDDQRYAEKYVEYNRQRKSRQKIRFELKNKGVDKEFIDWALDNCEDFNETELIRKAIMKKWKSEEKPDEKQLNKLFGYLSRQGFSGRDIWQVLKEENLT